MSSAISVESLSKKYIIGHQKIGAILGRSEAGIKRKSDEIVVFAEVERIFDIPLKHFFRGMQPELSATRERL